MIDRILLPLDGSERAETALPVVLDLARAFRSRVLLLRVVRKGDAGPGGYPPDPAEWALGRCAATAYLEALRSRFQEHQIATEVHIAEGCPADEIVEAVERHEVDLVAITSHGEGGDSQFKISGTAHKVLTAARASVLLLPSGQPGTWTGAIERVLVPLDGSARAEWALRVALSVAREGKGELIVLHVVLPPSLEVPGVDEELVELAARYTARSKRLAGRYLKEAIERLGVADVALHPRVLVGNNVTRTLLRVAEAEGAGLVVLSAHGADARVGVKFGTVTRGVVDHANLPVLVLQDAPAVRLEQSREAQPGVRWGRIRA